MYRLLIIDDEPFILEWLYELFQQHHELDLDIYKASSGLEALDLLSKAKIDIVLTDIKMPEMDGLELFNIIRQSWPLCKVIFLTAYDDFEYAYIANKGNAAYILKTESDEGIIEAVEKEIKEIDDSIKREELIKNAKRQIEKTLPIMQREFLTEIIKADESLNIDQNQLDELAIDLVADEELLLLIGRIDNWYLTESANERAKQSAIMQTLVQRHFEPKLRYAFLQFDNSIMVWIIQPKKDTEDRTESSGVWEKTAVYVEGSLESIQDQYKKSLEATSSFVLDSKPCSWKLLPQRFSSLLSMMNYAGVSTSGLLLTKAYDVGDGADQQEQYNSCLRQMNIWLWKMHSLKAFLEIGQRREFFSLFTEMWDNMAPIIKAYPSLGAEVYFSIYLMLLTYINRYEFMIEKMSVCSEFSNLMNSDVSSEEIYEYFQKIADMIFINQENERDKKDYSLIDTINEYIQSNLDKDLSLIKLAEHVFLNPTYLSRLYKNLTDTNLSEYIYNTRLNKAKKLLKESNLKIYEIANAVGFESVAYFIRSFKKSTGITPQEYRERIIETQL